MTAQPTVAEQREQIRRNRRIGLITGLVVVLLVGYWFIGWPKIGPSGVTNKSRALSLDVPTAWIASTPWNSPRTVWPLVGGPSRVAWSSLRRVEDIQMVGGTPGSLTHITIYMDLADYSTAEMHARELGTDLKKHGVPVTPPVKGSWGSLATRSNNQSSRVQEVVTIRSLHYIVTAKVSAPDEAALQVANDALATLTVRDDK